MPQKISDFLPTVTNNKMELYTQTLPWFDEFLKSRSSVKAQDVGVELLYFDWLRSAYAYRRMLIQDLCLVAFDIAEVRACIMVRRNEVFRKGFDEWEPRFVVKCENCGKEFQTFVEHCDECYATEVQFQGYEDETKINDDGTQETIKNPIYKTIYSKDERGEKIPSKVRSPDLSQVHRFEEFKKSANGFSQGLEDVLRQAMEFTYIADDGYILRNKEYFFDDNRLVGSRIAEIRSLHPALVEFDLDKNGLPKKSHYICLEHRNTVRESDGPCLECGKETQPVTYVYNHRGKKIYLLDTELLHLSLFSPSQTYGYCYDSESEVLTTSGFKFIKDLTYSDELATRNNKGFIEYQKPIALIKMPHTGELISVEDKNVSLLCTPEHRLFVDRGGGFEKLAAKELIKENVVRFSRTANWEGREQKFFTLDEHITIRSRKSKPVTLTMYQWARLLGCYMAAGSHGIIFGGQVVKEKIKTYLNMCGVSFSENAFRKNNVAFHLSNERVIESLKEAVGATVKSRTLDYVKTLPVPAQRIIIDTALELSRDVLWSKFKFTEAYNVLSTLSQNIDGIGRENELTEAIVIGGTSTTCEFKKYTEKKIPMDVWCEFLGYYLSEGSTSKCKNQQGYVIQIAQEKKDYLQDIACCLEKTPFKWRKVKSGWVTCDAQLGNYLTRFGKSKNKYIPQDIKKLSKRQLQILLLALEKGDGSRGYYYYTTSKQLRDDFQEIALKCGLSTKVGQRVKNGCYEIEIQRSYHRAINVDCQKSAKTIPFNDFVYCCQVPNDIIFIKRHGKTYWSCNSILLSLMQKALTLSGMDRFLYRYFFERKTPTGIILTYTDDPQSLEVARSRIEAKMMDDPTYVPWVAVSQKTGRGRTDFVRLFHTLNEMDYLPVRNEIRERIAMMFGVPPLWQSDTSGMQGLGSSSRQLEMFSRVVESDQRLLNEKIIPTLLADFGITDWKIKVKTPEEKTEEARMALSTQRIQAANVLFMMGFDIDLAANKGGKIDDINFIVSGRAQRPEMPVLGPGGMSAGNVTMPEQEGEGETKPVADAGQEVKQDVKNLMNKTTNKHLPFGTEFDRAHGLHNASDSHKDNPADRYAELKKEFDGEMNRFKEKDGTETSSESSTS